jgi:dihydroorotate dehydrogenase
MPLIRVAYQKLLKPLLFRFDPEGVHRLFVRVGEILGFSAFGRWLVARLYGYRGADVSRVIDGLRYPVPVVMAAGFDYNARLTQILGSVGFGGVEVGSVSARPCAGNEPPRLRRAVKSQSLIVYKGLRNDGVDRIIERLKARRSQPGLVVGVSVAMTNDCQTSTVDAAIDDYEAALRKLSEAGVGDYYTINVSCPNAHLGENFAHPERLRRLLARLDTVPVDKPRYAKMPIGLDWETFRELIDILREHAFAGVVIGNLNKDYASLDDPSEAPAAYRGGLSGKPCRGPSTELIRKTRAYVGPEFTIIGCGGILDAADALEKLEAGADLVQLITGMIFEGPHLMRDIARALARRQRERGEQPEARRVPERGTEHGHELAA